MTDGYELNAEPRVPDLPGIVVLREDSEELLDAIAADLLVHSGSCISSFGAFHLALDDSVLVHTLIIKLMTDPKYRSIEWAQTHIWTANERRVPVGHEEHSCTALIELLVEPSGMPASQIHPMLGHHPQGCEHYENELRDHLGQREKGQDRLDCVIFGGDPRHVEGHSDPANRLVGLSADENEMTLTQRTVRGARSVVVGLSGGIARDTVKVLESGDLVPGIEPLGGTLKWYLDHEACV